MDHFTLASIPTWEYWALGLLFVGSFFFSGTETALTSLGEAKARQLQERLGDRGRILTLWIERPRMVLTALLIGNNLVNVAAATVATDVALALFRQVGLQGAEALAVVTGVMTLLLLVFGEITPKTIAREHAERLAVRVLWLLRPFYLLFYPATWVLARMAAAISRGIGGEPARPLFTDEDVDWVIGQSAREGALEEVKEQLLTSVLEFTDLRVKEIMVPRTQVAALELTSGPAQVLDVAEQTGHSRFPVFEESIDEVVGILSVKDLIPVLREPGGKQRPANLKPWLRPAWFVPELMKVSHLMSEMQRRRIHLAVVVDEFGGTAGIVTLEDVVEEIVGEIRDEHDVEEPSIVRLSDGRVLVEAGMLLRDLEDEIDVEFPEDGDYESLAGFLIASVGTVPKVGKSVRHGGFEFTVRAANERRVLRVEVAPAPVDEAQDGGGDGPADGSAA